MPTTDIIGYLWSKRQALELDGIPDVLNMVSDLQHVGLICVEVSEIKVFGAVIDTQGRLVKLDAAEWDELVHAALLSSAVEHTTNMIRRHEERDEE